MAVAPFNARVLDAGGGEVRVLVDRDTMEYPEVGEWVRIGPVPSAVPEAVIPDDRGEVGAMPRPPAGKRTTIDDLRTWVADRVAVGLPVMPSDQIQWLVEQVDAARAGATVIREHEAIIRALADHRGPVVAETTQGGQVQRCVLCGADDTGVTFRLHGKVEHAPACPWLRSRLTPTAGDPATDPGPRPALTAWRVDESNIDGRAVEASTWFVDEEAARSYAIGRARHGGFPPSLIAATWEGVSLDRHTRDGLLLCPVVEEDVPLVDPEDPELVEYRRLHERFGGLPLPKT